MLKVLYPRTATKRYFYSKHRFKRTDLIFGQNEYIYNCSKLIAIHVDHKKGNQKFYQIVNSLPI